MFQVRFSPAILPPDCRPARSHWLAHDLSVITLLRYYWPVCLRGCWHLLGNENWQSANAESHRNVVCRWSFISMLLPDFRLTRLMKLWFYVWCGLCRIILFIIRFNVTINLLDFLLESFEFIFFKFLTNNFYKRA